jgi:membrane-associated phospholipid phosphatase
VLTGAHYAVDVLAAAVLVAASVLIYARVVEPWWMTAADEQLARGSADGGPPRGARSA